MKSQFTRRLLASAIAVLVLGLAPKAAAGSAKGSAADDCVGGVNVPNHYNQPFCVKNDEVLIFAANYKPFEASVTPQRTAEKVFDTVIGDKLRQAFPNLKIKYATWDYPVRYEDLQAAGVVPDIILDSPYNRIARDLKPRGWVQDMTPMLKQAGLDIGKLDQAAVEQVKSRSSGGLYGVPVFVDDYVLYYNKKIFDKFGVRYPKPGMTFDQIYKLAKKLTRQVGLDAYKGYMQHPDYYLQYNQMGLYPFTPTGSWNPAPEDMKVDITTPGWQKLADSLNRLLSIPHNGFTTTNDFLKGDMSRPGHVAMAVDTLSKLPTYAGNDLFIKQSDVPSYDEWRKSIDVGVASVPLLGKGSRTTYQPNETAAFIPPQSRHQQDAINVVKWLVSEDGQAELSRHAIKGVRQSPAVVNSFGKAVPELTGVDTSGVYWGSNAVLQNYQNTKYWDIPMYAVFRQHVLRDGMTTDSALTAAETEDIPAYIRSQAAAGLDW
ncbi:extracellular solute-binding protein [Actinoallomurus sp. NPDC050550]|uniref:ABC transporter substrate-binding protein n=1 Tax=Actinoallomurus sp. NPDC050550 TaxID=3154937 RepID=UPI0033FA7CCA